MSRPDPVALVLAAYPVIHHALRQRGVVSATAPAVSSHQATILAHIEHVAGCTLTELAGLMEVSLPTMSLLVTRLVQGDLVRRDRDPEDGRRVALRLTTAGERVLGQRSLLDPERVRALFGRLTPAERTAGVAGITTLARAVERTHLEPGPVSGPSERP